MNYLKKSAVCIAAIIAAANSLGYMPYNAVELPAFTANAADIVATGECGTEGDNVTWQLDSEGTLTISGSGNMTNWTGTESIFAGNENIKSVVIEKSVTSIGKCAFVNCKNIEKVTTPSSVVKIGEKALEGCESLKGLYIANRNCEIFDSADTVPSSAQIYCYSGSYAYEYAKKYDRKVMYRAEGAKDNGTCGENVKWRIGDDDFLIISGQGAMTDWTESPKVPWYGHKEIIKGITISDGVTSIGKFAFCSLENAESVKIPESVTAIGGGAFSMCSKLPDIKLHAGISEIGSSAFRLCTGMEAITIENPECVIGDSVETFPAKAVIHGYSNSTAQAYAEKYNRKFVAIDEKPAAADLGDVNGDGKIDSSDASAVLAEYANVQTGGAGEFTESQLKSADVNNDSKTDSADASKILAYYAMISTGKEPSWD